MNEVERKEPMKRGRDYDLHLHTCWSYDGFQSSAGTDTDDKNDLRTRFGRHSGEAEWLEEILERLPGVVAGSCLNC